MGLEGLDKTTTDEWSCPPRHVIPGVDRVVSGTRPPGEGSVAREEHEDGIGSWENL